MEPSELVETVRRAVQLTVAGKISDALVPLAPSTGARALIAVGGVVVLAGVRGLGRAPAAAAVTIDLAVTVAVSSLLRLVPATGPDALPLTLAHYCVVLLVAPLLAPSAGGLRDAFLGSVQYLTAVALAGAVVATGSSVVALAAAAGFAFAAGWDRALSLALAQAALAVLRLLTVSALPEGMRLPSIVAVLCLLRPLHRHGLLGGADGLYSFALYQSGDALRDAVGGFASPFAGVLACAAAGLAAPVPALRAVAQIAAVGGAADWVVAGLQSVADTDPFPSLLSLLVFARVLVLFASPGPE
jgi:hypothetical protein